ncbi:hypothetical protein LOK74_05735 [Brevibacillus humidisoli]|uniref:hypothetical protein n=1 Tax=Brevibacillus humidisoli TaxID=2895522 RepID=UPI001E286197|nr:hypothetical protein [Brevibacillus humidisoli]UFJ41998.1 hypothetical protein LOK74_05735 [Brevibacillus humidisoli]
MRQRLLFLILPVVALLTACSLSTSDTSPPPSQTGPDPNSAPSAASGDPINLSSSGSEPLAQIPFDYAAMKEPVLIQWEKDPRIHSPIQSVVADTPQHFFLFFREPMDRSSVEDALKRQAAEHFHPLIPTFAYQWASDRQLRLTVEIPKAAEPDIGSRSYLLSVNGAITKSGTVLQEPPSLVAVVYTPSQLWKVSTDGEEKIQLRAFDLSYPTASFIGPDKRYLLLSRYKEYCECDARLERLYALYDTEQNELIPYPIPLQTHYLGEGTFTADTRGFFYAKSTADVTVPTSDTTVNVQVDGYVHGANFSRDHSHLIMAVGAKEQRKDFDLLIYDLKTQNVLRLPNAIKGEEPRSALDDAEIGIAFWDDGDSVHFAAVDGETYQERRYQYSWQTQKITDWSPPVQPQDWSGFSSSSDGLYRLYPNAGLYKGKQLVEGERIYDGVWLDGTHTILYKQFVQSTDNRPHTVSIQSFDADTGEQRTLIEGLHHYTQLVGTSADGKWFYLMTVEPLDAAGDSNTAKK